MKTLFAIAFMLLVMNRITNADEEVANWPILHSSESGTTYAKSLPDSYIGQKGKTKVFSVGRQNDSLICEYDWYAHEFYIGGNDGSTLIRFGPWHRGHELQKDHLAIGIYRNGKTVRDYSTVEMAKIGSGVSTSKTHYQVFKQRLGFRWLKNTYVYQIKGVSGKVFTFNVDNGTVLESAPVQTGEE
jgi:hypothetical protein